MDLQGGTIILHGVVGSHAYGMNHADSDVDTAGIFMLPMEKIISLFEPVGTVTRTDGADKDDEPDFTFHELKKYMGLAMKNNPTALEYLWLDEYLTLSEVGQVLINNRKHFLSQAIRKSYGGYARQQLQRLRSTGNFGSDLKKRQAKNARHLVRLCLQAKNVLETGELRLKLTDLEKNLCSYMGDVAVENPDYFAECAELMLDDVDACKSDLPEKPDADYLDMLYRHLRTKNDHI
jgi:predicted nucleotidyltransferase